MPQRLTRSLGNTNQPNTGERFLPSLMRSITGLEHWHRYLFASGYCAGKDVLDVACGEGYGTALLAQAAKHVTGVDIDRRSIDDAKAKYGENDVTWLSADCTAIPVADASFDVVVSFETIEHLTQHTELLREIKRVLRPGGVLVMSSPNKTPYRALHGINEFHPRELERSEFHELLRAWFRHVALAEQQALHASVIENGAAAAWHFELVDGAFQRSDRLEQLAYSIAVASDAELAPTPPRSLLLDTNFERGAHRYHEHSAIYEARDPGVTAMLEEHAVLVRQRQAWAKREAELQGEVGKAQTEVRVVNEILATVRQELATMTAAQATAVGHAASLERVIATLGPEVQRLRGEVAALRDSWSFRSMAIPRAIVDALRSWLRPAAASTSRQVRKHEVSGRFVPDATRPLPTRGLNLIVRAMRQAFLRLRGVWPRTLHAVRTIRGAGVFDPAWYRSRYADIADFGDGSCLVHYCVHGWRERRQPCVWFEASAYLAANPHLDAARINPLLHFVLHGRREGRWLPPAGSAAGEANADAGAVADNTAAIRAGDEPTSSSASGAHAIVRGKTIAIEAGSDHWAGYADFRTHVLARREANRRAGFGSKPRLVAVDSADFAAALRAIDATLTIANQPRVSIAIPVHGQLQVTLECLLSIAAHTRDVPFEVVVVDDASPADASAALASLRQIRYVRQDRQVGFGATCNHAVEQCRGEVVVLLNSDTQVQPDWLPALLEPLADPTVGMVGPMLLFPGGALQEAGGRLRADGSGVMVGLFEDASAARFGWRRNVDYVSGACAAFRRSDFLAVGGFDARFAPAYAEDADLCLALRARGQNIVYQPRARVVHHLSKTTRASGQLNKLALAYKHQGVLQEKWSRELQAMNAVRLITFYLPQFHPIEENDRWWGEGFTEWRNVAGARPRFEGHYQPRRPADLGYYDLMTPGVMQRQAELARRYGVHGFAFYYYRFGDRRILERPIEAINADPQWSMPFCLTWANENWTRRWDGQDRDVLLQQTYAPAELEAMLADFVRSFRHPAYIRVNGAPLLLIYNPLALPNAKVILDDWRAACRQQGIGEIYVVAVESFSLMRQPWNPTEHGFDATVEFPPHECGQPLHDRKRVDPQFTGAVHDYRRMVEALTSRELPAYKRFRCVAPGWDNTARRQNDPNVFVNAGPGEYQVWLECALDDARSFLTGDERLVFVNAWNEWAEGAYLEPDLRFGHAFLQATKNALQAEA
jgi:O-antigen biosynthesis protein